jgi:alkanesulfonate monooxygenase SsuD/methylene tetrahydromethanopterin reductase-like flavin-dependent oxidoreductase (luciferase family)
MGIPYFHMDVFKKNFEFFRECCDKEGYKAEPRQMGLLAPIYISDSDEKARAEYEPHLWYFVKKLLPGLLMTPPGYTSSKSALKILEAVKKKQFMISCETWDDIERGDFAIVGSARTVRDKLVHHLKDLGAGNVLGLFQLATMPGELTRRNMELFAREVMPAVRRELAGVL